MVVGGFPFINPVVFSFQSSYVDIQCLLLKHIVCVLLTFYDLVELNSAQI